MGARKRRTRADRRSPPTNHHNIRRVDHAAARRVPASIAIGRSSHHRRSAGGTSPQRPCSRTLCRLRKPYICAGTPNARCSMGGRCSISQRPAQRRKPREPRRTHRSDTPRSGAPATAVQRTVGIFRRRPGSTLCRRSPANRPDRSGKNPCCHLRQLQPHDPGTRRTDTAPGRISIIRCATDRSIPMVERVGMRLHFCFQLGRNRPDYGRVIASEAKQSMMHQLSISPRSA